MALQVSVLPKDLFVLLRPSAHYSTTLCATARGLPPDTTACCCLFVRSHYLSDTCIRLLVCAAVSEDLLVLSRPFSHHSTTLCATARYSPLDTTTRRHYFRPFPRLPCIFQRSQAWVACSEDLFVLFGLSFHRFPTLCATASCSAPDTLACRHLSCPSHRLPETVTGLPWRGAALCLEVCNRIWLQFLFSPELAISWSLLPFLDTLTHLHLILAFHLLFYTSIRFLTRAAASISRGSRSRLQALHPFRNLLSRALPCLWKRCPLFPLQNLSHTLGRSLGRATASSTGSSRSHLFRLCYFLGLAFAESTFCMAKTSKVSSAHPSQHCHTLAGLRSVFCFWKFEIAHGSTFGTCWDLPLRALPRLWQKLTPSLLHILLNTHPRLLDRSTTTSSGSFRLHLIVSLTSGTCRPALCLVYSKNHHRFFFTSIHPSTFSCALRISQAWCFCISPQYIPQFEIVLQCAGFSLLLGVSIFQHYKSDIETHVKTCAAGNFLSLR
jgi:hypothetical protein